MKNKKILVYGGIIALILILVFWLMGIYNNAVEYEQVVDEKWGNVESLYEGRFDKYTAMLDVVEGAAKQEQEVLIKVTEARALVKQGMNATTPEGLENANSGLRAITSSLMGYQERYPELKSMKLFENFQIEISGQENRLNIARKKYNEAVKDYNTHIKKFPNSMITGGFDKREMFQATTEKKELPNTKMDI